MKYAIIISILLFSLFTACSAQNPQSEIAVQNQQPTQLTDSAHLKDFNVEAYQFSYNPAEIRVKQGDSVHIKLTTRDVPHSLMIKEYELNIKTSPDLPGEATFVADKVGRFEWKCKTPCGSNHNEMRGTFIVE